MLFTYGDNSDFAFTFPDGPLAVSVNIVEDNKLSLTGIKLKGGQLATDVYMAVFPGAVDSNISLNFTVIEEGEKGKEYTVKLKDPTLLERAYWNTVKMLDDLVEVKKGR